MIEKSKKDQMKFDQEEEEILALFENDEWKTIKNNKKEKEQARKIAVKTVRKDIRINIRLSNSDVLQIKQIAAFEGLPYQTLIASILHKFASGQI